MVLMNNSRAECPVASAWNCTLQEHSNGGVRTDASARRHDPDAAALLRPGRRVLGRRRAAHDAHSRLALDDLLLRASDDHLHHCRIRMLISACILCCSVLFCAFWRLILWI